MGNQKKKTHNKNKQNKPKKQSKKSSNTLVSDLKYMTLRFYLPIAIVFILFIVGLTALSQMQTAESLSVSVYREGIYKGKIQGKNSVGFTVEFTEGFGAGEEHSYMLKETPPNTTAFDDLVVGEYYSFGLNHDHVSGDYRKSVLIHILDKDGNIIWEYNPADLRGRS